MSPDSWYRQKESSARRMNNTVKASPAVDALWSGALNNDAGSHRKPRALNINHLLSTFTLDTPTLGRRQSPLNIPGTHKTRETVYFGMGMRKYAVRSELQPVSPQRASVVHHTSSVLFARTLYGITPSLSDESCVNRLKQ